MKMNRRDFMKGSASSAALLPSPLHAFVPARVYTVAVAGLGAWGSRCVDAALATGRLRIIAGCDPEPSRVANFSGGENAESGRISRFGSFTRMLANVSADIVLVALPQHLTAPAISLALQRGTHVFAGGPAARTSQEFSTLCKISGRSRRQVQVAFANRVDPATKKAARFLQGGGIGRILGARLSSCWEGLPRPAALSPNFDWQSWCGKGLRDTPSPLIFGGGWKRSLKYGDGAASEFGVEMFDTLLHLGGFGPPSEVMSYGGNRFRHPPDCDAPDHLLTMFDLGDTRVSWEHRTVAQASGAGSCSITLQGEKGVLTGGATHWAYHASGTGKGLGITFESSSDPDGLVGLWNDLLSALDHGSSPSADLARTETAHAMATLAMRSFHCGRKLSWDREGESLQCEPAGLL